MPKEEFCLKIVLLNLTPNIEEILLVMRLPQAI